MKKRTNAAPSSSTPRLRPRKPRPADGPPVVGDDGTPGSDSALKKQSRIRGVQGAPKRGAVAKRARGRGAAGGKRTRNSKLGVATVVQSGIYGDSGASSQAPATRGRGRGGRGGRGSRGGQGSRGGRGGGKGSHAARGGKRTSSAHVVDDVPMGEDDVSPDVGAKETKSKENDDDHVGAGRSYFEAHRGQLRTSHYTLANIHMAPAAALQTAMSSLPNAFEAEQKAKLAHLVKRFPRYLFMLSAGHSLLFYGYGSKRLLLDTFAQKRTDFDDVVVVSGYNPSVSARTVLSQIADDVLKLHGYPKRCLLDYVDAIRDGIGSRRVTVVVHNIDGVSLRAPDTQIAFSALSAVGGVSFAASVDHVNAPLLWDGATYAKFRWAWIKADTFAPYRAETVFGSKPMLQGGGERRVEGAIMLLKSLSQKARKVFSLLAERQAGSDVSTDQGTEGTERHSRRANQPQIRTTFNDLYDACRTKFLTSSTSDLKTILTELETHELLESRRGADAAEQLWIPLAEAQLKNVLSQVET